MGALSLLIIIGLALLVIAMPYFLVYSFFRLGLKSDKPGIKRWTGSALFVVVVGLIFYGDILFSSVQLARLCHTKAGIYVYKRVMVPDEMWDFKSNRVRSNFRGSEILDHNLDAEFVVGGEGAFEHRGVRTLRLYIYHNENGKTKLVEKLGYIGRPGWFAENFPFASAPNRECSVKQAYRSRYTLDDIPQEVLTTFFKNDTQYDNWYSAFHDAWYDAELYAIHPSSYIKHPSTN